MVRKTWIDLVQSAVDFVLEQISRTAMRSNPRRNLIMPPHQQA